MKLFTKDIDKKLFAQFEKGSDLESQMVVAKIFNPYGRGVWYILNSDPSDPDYLWAIVDLFDVEAGSVSRSELESIKVPPFRLPLERDMYFEPINAAELYRGLRAGKTYAEGGEISIEAQNKDMLINYAEELEHHIKEFEEAAKGAEKVMPWVIAKIERASTDLSDVTHYLASENEKRREYGDGEGEEEYANGGEVKWENAHYGDNALVVSENKMGIIIKPYGRKFHLKFADGTEKTYDANELKFFKDMDDFDMGGEVEGVDLFEDYENIPEKVQQVLDNYADAFEDGDYKELEKANKALLKIGYTFEYGLDGQAYDLRKVGEKGKSDSYARGGEITVKVGDKVKSKSGVDGEVYESTGTFFKLQDKYGNKNTKFYSTRDFKRSDIKSMSLGGMTAGRWYRDKSGEEFRFIGKVDSGENKDKLLFTDGQKKVFKTLDDFEGGRPKENKFFGLFPDGGMMAKGGMVAIEKKGDKKVATIIHNGNVFFVEYYIDNPEIKHIKGDDANTYFSVVDNKYSYGKSDKEYIAVTKKLINAIKNNKVAYYEEGGKMAMGGKVKFADKVKSIKASLLERKKVSPKVQKDYGKTYSPKEAEESAKRIVGAMTAKERLMAKRKKGKK
jgi:hypothetical protein